MFKSMLENENPKITRAIMLNLDDITITFSITSQTFRLLKLYVDVKQQMKILNKEIISIVDIDIVMTAVLFTTTMMRTMTSFEYLYYRCVCIS